MQLSFGGTICTDALEGGKLSQLRLMLWLCGITMFCAVMNKVSLSKIIDGLSRKMVIYIITS